MNVDIQALLAKAVEANPSILTGIFQQLAAAPKAETTPAPTAPVKESKRKGDPERFLCEVDLSSVTKKTWSLKKSKKKGVYVIIRWINKLNGREMGHVYLYKSDFMADVNHTRGDGGTKAFNAVIAGGITEYVA